MSQSNNKQSLLMVIVIIVGMLAAVWWIVNNPENGHNDGHAEEAHEDEVAKGPHGGRLLVDKDFMLEITVFETGVPPEFHVYPYITGKPVAPEEVELTIELKRIDGQVDQFSFSPQADFLRGVGVVTEPHSFDVSVSASYQGQSHQWHYDNYEGRTQIASAMAQESGISTEKAKAGLIKETLSLSGRIHTDPSRLSKVRARYPGMVKSVMRSLGDQVRQGDVLATVQSNESLQTYSVKAPISGMIVHRNVQIGEATGEEPLFIITDQSQVWAEFDVFGSDLGRIKTGQSIDIETLDNEKISAKIDWISPLAAHASQSVRARVVISNKDGRFRSGQFVRGQVTIAEHAVPLAVRVSAIQRFRDFQVVFSKHGDSYEVRMLELGRRDQKWVEVLGGLKPGSEYVTENSYLIKADIEKSGASHDH